MPIQTGGRDIHMKKTLLIFGILLISGACARRADVQSTCDRACLVQLMDRYLAAVVKHDPAGVPIASDAKLVQNLKETPVGKGLWETATGGPTEFKIYVADPVAQQIGFMGVMQDQGKPVLLGARLKFANGKITEIDHMVSPLNNVPPGLLKPRPGLVTTLQPAERVPRAQMLEAANGYYEAIEQSNGKAAPFADECQRRENGVTTVNDREQTPEKAAKDSFSVPNPAFFSGSWGRARRRLARISCRRDAFSPSSSWKRVRRSTRWPQPALPN